jgi:hypothetical protein
MFESMHRRPRKGGTEQDEFSNGWRRVHHYRPGRIAATKARHNRRVRHKVHAELNYGG